MLIGYCLCIFGQFFYVGWGLLDDQYGFVCRQLCSIYVLFVVSYLFVFIWYDFCCDCLIDFEGVLCQIEVEVWVWWQDYVGYLVYGMWLWKCFFISCVFGNGCGVWFIDVFVGVMLVWVNCVIEVFGVLWVEDGFICLCGLGVVLVLFLLLVVDDLGIYYDLICESCFEWIMVQFLLLGGVSCVQVLFVLLIVVGVIKYNFLGNVLDLL